MRSDEDGMEEFETPYGMLLAFADDNPKWTLGFEIGRLWGLLNERPDEEVSELAHPENAEMLLRLAEATNRTVRSEVVSEDWIEVVFGAAAGPPEGTE